MNLRALKVLEPPRALRALAEEIDKLLVGLQSRDRLGLGYVLNEPTRADIDGWRAPRQQRRKAIRFPRACLACCPDQVAVLVGKVAHVDRRGAIGYALRIVSLIDLAAEHAFDLGDEVSDRNQGKAWTRVVDLWRISGTSGVKEGLLFARCNPHKQDVVAVGAALKGVVARLLIIGFN